MCVLDSGERRLRDGYDRGNGKKTNENEYQCGNVRGEGKGGLRIEEGAEGQVMIDKLID